VWAIATTGSVRTVTAGQHKGFCGATGVLATVALFAPCIAPRFHDAVVFTLWAGDKIRAMLSETQNIPKITGITHYPLFMILNRVMPPNLMTITPNFISA